MFLKIDNANIKTYLNCSVFAISCLTMLCGSLIYKLYYFIMVKVLAKLPEDTSNRLTEVGNCYKTYL